MKPLELLKLAKQKKNLMTRKQQQDFVDFYKNSNNSELKYWENFLVNLKMLPVMSEAEMERLEETLYYKENSIIIVSPIDKLEE